MALAEREKCQSCGRPYDECVCGFEEDADSPYDDDDCPDCGEGFDVCECDDDDDNEGEEDDDDDDVDWDDDDDDGDVSDVPVV
jgi:hypothetical protein